MFDGLRSGPSGTFELGGAQFKVTTTIRDHPNLTAMWVEGLHWPDCCKCEGRHDSIGFGSGYVGSRFRMANVDFWRHSGVDVALVEAQLNSWLDGGDLPD